MKKLIPALLIIILISLAIFFTFFRKNTTLWFSNTRFSIKKAKEITQIVIRNPEQNITLFKNQNYWKLDSTKVRQDLVNLLLSISEELEIVSPVPLSQHDSVLKMLEQGTQIAFYSGRRNPYIFRICKWHDIIYAQHYRSKSIYRLSVKGYPYIDLTKLYNPNKNNWITNLLFGFPSDEIRLIQMDYRDKPDKSFKIEKLASGKFSIRDNRFEMSPESIDTTALNEYLHFFSDIRYYEVRNKNEFMRKNVLSEIPFFQLIIKGRSNTLAEIRGYKKLENKSDTVDPFEFYSTDPDNNLILLKYNDFDPILVSPDYFLKK